uniref:SAM_MT_RSMB_NOP domain-containing protein n=1 Tax=Echinostoma caproni TaxID=27848 RepID=A0A183B2I6_9TREM
LTNDLVLQGSTNEVSQLFFDRVLADVPCSGDGTLRKNPDIWLRWNPNLGLSEHALQSRILRRGLELLRDPIGNDKKNCARLVYSTCSFNPLENEAVVASLLNACQGTVLLVDPERLDCVTAELDTGGGRKFRIRPGLSTWRVMTRKGVWFERFEDVPASLHSNIRPSMFPPTNVSELHLDRCMRVVPHDQNTGGFFIAVLEKVAPLPWVKQSHMMNKVNPEAPVNHEKTEPKPTITPNELLKKPRILVENPFTYVDPSSDEDWAKIRDYYGIMEESRANRYISGRWFCASNLLYRSAGEDALRRRQFYYTNHFVRDLIVHNACRDGVDLADAFLPATGGRRILLTEDQYSDLVLLLEEEMPLLSRFSEATQSLCTALSPGPVLIEYRPSGSSKVRVYF